MTAVRRALVDTVLTGDPTAPTATAGDNDQSVATTGFVTTAVASVGERAILLGRGGVITASSDCADFPITVPFACTLKRMKVTMKVAPSSTMSVQLRKAATPVTTAPTYSDVTGFVCTFVASRVLAIVDPTDVALSEGDMLNFSMTSADGQNATVEAIVTVAS